MRQDMHRLNKVRSLDIVGQRKLLSRGFSRDLDSLPTHQSMRSSVPHYTYPRIVKFTPALRWLAQQAGRVWNEVYAELRERFDTRNTQQGVILEHLLDKVERKVYFDDVGQPRVASAYGSWAVSGLYVHPVSGLLLLAQPKVGAARQRAEQRQRGQDAIAARRVEVSSSLQLHLVDGLWFWVELAPIVAPAVRTTKPYISQATGKVLVEAQEYLDHDSVCRDVLTGERFYRVPDTRWAADAQMQAYGQLGVYAKRKWQAARRDVERLARMH